MKKLLQLFLALASWVTIADIIVIHWILRKHRLYQGQHVLVAESSLLVLSLAAIMLLQRGSLEKQRL